MDRAGVETLAADRGARAGDMRMKYSFAIPYERVARLLRRGYPGRFRGLAGIDPSRGMRGLREFERGDPRARLRRRAPVPALVRARPDHAKYYPFYAKCCELDVPIMMQIGHCLDYQRDRVLPSVGRPITLDRVAIDFPELKLIGIHLGWPWTEEMIADLLQAQQRVHGRRRLRSEALARSSCTTSTRWARTSASSAPTGR